MKAKMTATGFTDGFPHQRYTVTDGDLQFFATRYPSPEPEISAWALKDGDGAKIEHDDPRGAKIIEACMRAR